MTATYQAADDMPAPSPIARLWQRQLNRYPNNGMRFLSLFIVVATTVVLYYQLYLSGGVAVQILGDLHMSFLYFVNIAVIGYAFGALASDHRRPGRPLRPREHRHGRSAHHRAY